MISSGMRYLKEVCTAAVVCRCEAGSSIERLRRVVICEVDKGYKTYLSICGEIQAPRVYVTSPQLAQGKGTRRLKMMEQMW